MGHTRQDLDFRAVSRMTNQIAIILGTLIVIALGLDYQYFDWTNTLFLARKLAALIEWMAFWR